MGWRGIAVVVVAVAGGARAADVAGHLRLWTGPGYDSNALRNFVSSPSLSSPDLFHFGVLTAEGAAFTPSWRLSGSYEAAVRAFVLNQDETSVLQRAGLEFLVAPWRPLALAVAGQARDRRGAGRDYADLRAEGEVRLVPGPGIDVRLRGGPHRFLYWQDHHFSYFGPEASLAARVAVSRRHFVTATGVWGLRTYNADAAPFDPANPPPPTPRRDELLSAGAAYSYRGGFQVTLGYAYLELVSNSAGEAMKRHRVNLAAGVRLPWQLTLLVSGAVQLSALDRLWLSNEILLEEDEERMSFVSLKLVRPFGRYVELDLRYSLYVGALVANGFNYQRHVFTFGMALGT